MNKKVREMMVERSLREPGKNEKERKGTQTEGINWFMHETKYIHTVYESE
jgi:hypothetical protein